MHCYDYNAVVYEDEIYCIGCLPATTDEDSDDVYPIFAGSEWDSYPICTVCGNLHEYVSLLNYD